MLISGDAYATALEVYPNPVSDVLYVKNLPGERVKYSIFNILGQEVNAGYSCGAIPVAALKKGLYFLQIENEKHKETTKFVVR